jgi:hypothetical protein
VGPLTNTWPTIVVSCLAAVLIIALNAFLLYRVLLGD